MQEVAEMPKLEDAAEPQTIQRTPLPVCPHCGADPVKLMLMFQPFPKGQIASLVYCGDCRKLLPAQIVGMQDQPRQIIQPGRPRSI